MNRGEFYRANKGSPLDPKRSRVFLIVSRQALVDASFSTVICAPAYAARHGLSTQMDVGPSEGLKQDSSVYCDELVSLPKNRLTDYVGALASQQLERLEQCLKIVLSLE